MCYSFDILRKYLIFGVVKIIIFAIIFSLPLIKSCYIEQECYTLNNWKGNYYSIEEMKNLSESRQTNCGGSCMDANITLICCPYQDEPQQYRLLHQSCLDAHLPYELIAIGTLTKPKEFPFMAALGWRVQNGNDLSSIVYRCGGTMIEYRYLITAAHCLHQFSDPPGVVRPGGFDLKSTATAIDYEIDKIIEHPNYEYPSLYNDIAIIRIKTRYIGDLSTVGRACIWYGPLEEAPVIAIGYGDTHFAGTSSSVLIKANLSTITNEECNEHYQEDKYRLSAGITSTQICAKDREKLRNTSTCQGDSGGPIIMYDMFKDYKQIAYIVGITSYGYGCGTGTPGIYTRVSEFYDWIEEVIFN